eukprot:scaffold870_cov393-Prasinococcus_capsulatus_cf.AAC.25
MLRCSQAMVVPAGLRILPETGQGLVLSFKQIDSSCLTVWHEVPYFVVAAIGTSEEGAAGARQRGHSGFLMHHSVIHCQQKTWPQAVAVETVRGAKHKMHGLRSFSTAALLCA